MVDKALLEYVLLPKRMLGSLLDVSFERRNVRPFFDGSSAEIGERMEGVRNLLRWVQLKR